MAGPVGELRKHPYGRVDQLEDRYLGMVEAPSSNLGTSTPLLLITINGSGPCCQNRSSTIRFRFWLGTSTIILLPNQALALCINFKLI